MDADTPITPEALLEHTDWVRRLARSLVFDPDRAEDVVQETWRAALETPPRSKTDLRTWLAVVARNAARSLGRSESRRRVRETGAASGEALPDVTDVLEKAQLQKRVTDAVLELEEPYRSTLLLRYFEELKPAEIARRLGRPVNTVRTHIERGHAQLRMRLDDEFGSREAWGLAFLPLARLPGGAATSAALAPSFAGLIMLLKWSVVASLALVGWLAFSWLGEDVAPVEREELAGPSEVEVSESLPAPEAELANADRSGSADQRSEISPALAPAAPPEASPIAATAALSVGGRVVDAGGAALPGITLRFVDRNGPRLVDGWLRDGGTSVRMHDELLEAVREHPEMLDTLFQHSPDRAALRAVLNGEGVAGVQLTSDSEGHFGGQLPFESYDVSTASADLTLLGTGTHRDAQGQTEVLYVIAPLAPLAGRILDSEGAPATEVELTADMTLEGIHGFPVVLESSEGFRRWRLDPLGSDGSFRHEQLPVVPGLILRATTERSGSAQVLVDSQPRESIEMRLRVWSKSEPHVVTGRVLDAAGSAVEDARVRFSQEETSTDVEGRFRIEVGYLVDDSRLIVTKRGNAPALLDGLEPRLREDPLAVQDLVLRIGAATKVIRGRVVDQDGEPVTDAHVYLEGGDAFGNVYANVEDTLGGRSSPGVDVDGDGRFVYDGLYRSSYGLRAFQAGTFLACRVEGIAPGTSDVELVLPTRDRLPSLRGRVIDRAGLPVGGALLALSFTTLSDFSGGRHTRSLDLGSADADGRFEFTDVAHAHVDLLVRGAGVERTTFSIDPSQATNLELVVELRQRFQLDRSRFGAFDRFEAVDAAGESVTLTEFKSGVTTFRDRVRLNDDPTWPTFEVSDSATELVFYRGDAEALRVPLTLDRGTVTLLR